MNGIKIILRQPLQMSHKKKGNINWVTYINNETLFPSPGNKKVNNWLFLTNSTLWSILNTS